MTGIMVTTFVEDALGMDDEGHTVFAERNPIDAANAVVRAVREAAAFVMSAE